MTTTATATLEEHAHDQATRRFHLYGYPISHSASPFLHNAIFRALHDAQTASSGSAAPPLGVFDLVDTKTVDNPHFRASVRDDEYFAGSAVTMPLKVAVASTAGQPGAILDGLTDAGRSIGAVNTIVVERQAETGSKRFIGTNTDHLGVRHALLRQLAIDSSLPPSTFISTPSSAFQPRKYSAFLIGGGGTARSTCYALRKLNLDRIYLLNRDRSEMEAVKAAFPELDIRILERAHDFPSDDELAERPVVLGVGAIPAVEPQTEGEKAVYALAEKLFSLPPLSAASRPEGDDGLPLPPKRLFLEMCYKPRMTPILQMAGRYGWSQVGGIVAMIEQGLSQQRMWALGEASEEAAAAAADKSPLGAAVEEQARRLIENMGDIQSKPDEGWGK